jgi:Divergent InlB B-repeat domain/NHL repeat
VRTPSETARDLVSCRDAFSAPALSSPARVLGFSRLSGPKRVLVVFGALLAGILAAGAASVVGPVASADAALVHSFDSYLGGGSLSAPQALTVDQTTGDLYILEHGNGCVSRYYGDRGGPEALEPHDFPATGTNQVCGIEFREPPYFFGEGTANSQVAVDNSGTATEGKFYVNSPGPNIGDTAVTLGFDAEGNLDTELTERRTPDDYASLRWPCGVATDDAGNVYVDEALGGVQKYKHDDPVSDDDFEEVAGGTWPACYLAFDSHGGYHAFMFAGTVDRSSDDIYSTEGSVVKAATAEGLVYDEFAAGEVSESHGVAIDEANGTVYVSDTANGRIAVYQGTPAHRLGVDFLGTGLGAVSADAPPIEDCGDEGPCVGYYAASTIVLTATPQTHSVIGGWTGCDEVSPAGDECTVEITNADRDVFANFTRLQQTVTASTVGTGSGQVSDVNGLGAIQSCGDGGTCSGPYDEGSQIELIATPTGHSSFTGWSGDCSNQSGPCVLVVEGSPSVTAHFTAQHAVSVKKAGGGAGAVVSDPSGLDCGAVCVSYFTDGTTVTLAVVASAHSSFTGWSGAGCSGTGSCEVEAGEATKTVTASFSHDLPSAVTDPGASFVGQHVATVHGSVNPNGASVTKCVIEYGTSTAYGAQSPCAPSGVGSGEAPVPIGANLADLLPGTVYHYRLSATTVGGTANGSDQTFRTLDDTCDTNEALCPAIRPFVEARPKRCRKGRVLRKGRCVKRKSHKHRQNRGGGRG